MKPLLLLAALLPALAPAAPSLLLEYKFNEAAAPYASTGRLRAPLRGLGEKQAPGQPGSGVSGRPGDRAWDASANTTQGVGVPANDSALVTPADDLVFAGLQAFTLSFWYKTQQPLAQDAALRFIMKADRATEPVSRGLMLRSFKGALELRLGTVSPEGEGTPAEAVLQSTRFREGSGYHRTDTWIFAAITWDGQEVRFHVGDEKNAPAPAGGGPFVGRILDDPSLLVLANTRSFNRGLDGWLDNFRLHDGALSVAELDALRRADLGRP